MVTKRDYYEILSLSKTCSPEEVKKAYRQAALRYHPDRNPEDHTAEENFKQASEAYEVLSDPQKREMYDHYGHAGLSGTDFHPFTNVEDVFSSFGDIFEDFFGGGLGGRGRRSRSAAQHGGDLAYELPIEFLEAYQGCEKEIKVFKKVLCEECEGLGHPVSSKPATCPHCQGRGQVFHSQGFFTISSVCSACHGEGKISKVLCKVCHGHKVLEREKKLKVKIPAGVDTGNRLVLKGEGEPGLAGGHPGDLYVILHVKPHGVFKRQGIDLLMDLPISFAQAALGATLKVPTIKGEEDVEIPEGIETGENVVLKGKGFPEIHRSHHGNQILKIILKTPQHLSDRQKELLREFASEEKDSSQEREEKPKSKKKKGFWGD